MADDVFTGSINQFKKNVAESRQRLMNAYNTASQPAVTTEGGEGLNPFNVKVVHELVGRGKPEVAKWRYPKEFGALYKEEQAPQQEVQQTGTSAGNFANATPQQQQGQAPVQQPQSGNAVNVTITDNNGKQRVIQVQGANANYRQDGWGFDGLNFSTTSIQGEQTAEDKAWAESLMNMIDWSQLGGANGTTNPRTGRLYNNKDLLPVLVAKRLGMDPSWFLGLGHSIRAEVATKLLTDYYNTLEPENRQQIDNSGGLDKFVNSTLQYYGLDAGSKAKDDGWTAAGNALTGIGKGFVDQFENYGEGIKTFFGVETKKSDEEIARAKAEKEAEAASRTVSEREALQYFDYLIDQGRFGDAVYHVVSSPDAWGAFAGTTIGGMLADFGITNALIYGTAGIATVATGGTGGAAAAATATAAAAAANTAKVAKWSNTLKNMVKAGTFYGVSGLGMYGSLAKELKLDGAVLTPGSEAYKTLAAYGLIGTAISALPGTLESQLVSRMMKSGATAELAQQTSKDIVEQLTKKGFQFTAEGVKVPKKPHAIVSGVKWLGKKAGSGVSEGGTELVQETWGDVIKQASKGAQYEGDLNYDNVNYGKALKEGSKGAVLGSVLGTAGTFVPGGNKGKPNEAEMLKIGQKAWGEIQKDKAWKEFSLAERRRMIVESDNIDYDAYNENGDLRTPDDPPPPPGFVTLDDFNNATDEEKNARRDYERRVEEAVLRKRFEQQWQAENGVDPNNPVATEPVFTAPEDLTIDYGDIDNEDKYRRDRDQRAIDIAREFSVFGTDEKGQSIGGTFTPTESPVKDIRWNNQSGSSDTAIDVDADWKSVSGTIEKNIASRQKALEKAVETVNTAREYQVDERMPEQVRNSRLAAREVELQRIEAEQDAVNTLRGKLRRVNNIDDVVSVLSEATNQGVFTGDQLAKAQRLQQQADYANRDTYAVQATDNFTRFSDRDRETFVGKVEAFLQEAGIAPPPRGQGFGVENLSETLDTAMMLVRNSRYGNSIGGQRTLKKMQVLNTALRTNLPETLYKLTEQNLKKVADKATAVESDLWQPKSGMTNTPRDAFNKNALKKEVLTVLGTLTGRNEKGNNANIIDNDTNNRLKNLVKQHWDSHPEQVLEEIQQELASQAIQRTTWVSQQQGDITAASDVQRARKDIATLNNGLSLITEMRNDFRTGNVRIAPGRNAVTRNQMLVGADIYDPVIAAIPISESADIVSNVKQIAKAFNLTTSTGAIPDFKGDMAGHVAHLATEIENLGNPRAVMAADQYKNSAVKATGKNEMAVREKAVEYLRNVQKRLEAYQQGTAQPEDIVQLNDGTFEGGLLQATLEEAKDHTDSPIKKFVTEWQASLNVAQTTADEDALLNELVEQRLAETRAKLVVEGPPLLPPPTKSRREGRLETEQRKAEEGSDNVWHVNSKGETQEIDLNHVKVGEDRNQFLLRTEMEQIEAGAQQDRERYELEEQVRQNNELYEERRKVYSGRDMERKTWEAIGGTFDKDGNAVANPSGLVRITEKGIQLEGDAVRNLIDTARGLASNTANNGEPTPDDIRKTLQDMLNVIRETNPDVFPGDSFDFVVEHLVRTDKITKWATEQNNKAKPTIINGLVGQMNNHLLGEAIGHEGVALAEESGLKALLGRLAQAYTERGDKSLGAIITKVLRPTDPNLLNDHLLDQARNVTIRVVNTDEDVRAEAGTSADIHGFYNVTTNEIVLSRQDQDIANTLMHELQHAVLQGVMWSDTNVDGSTFGTSLTGHVEAGKTTAEKKIKEAVTKLVKLAETDPEARAHLDALGLLNDEERAVQLMEEGKAKGIRYTSPRWVEAVHVEELISLGLDATRGALPQNQQDAVNYLLRNTFSEYAMYRDGLAQMVTGWLSDIRTGKPSNKPSPLAQGTLRFRRRGQNNTNNQFLNNPNPNNAKDTTTVYHFGFEETNNQVSADPMAWFDGYAWNFYYVDAQGSVNRTSGMTLDDVMLTAQNLGLHIDQREKDVMYKQDPQRGDQFMEFTPPIAKMWRSINRVFRGDDQNVNPLVRKLMSATQKWAVEQHGVDQFFQFFENTLTNLTGTDFEGKLTTTLNRIRTKTKYQLNEYGVNGETTVYELRKGLEDFMGQIGWSQQKIDDTLYSMRAGDYQQMIMDRSPNDPRWKNIARDPAANLSGFRFKDANGNMVEDADGSKYWATLSAQDKKIANDLRKLVTNLNDAVLKLEKESGRISDQQYQDQVGKFYVPLRNETDEATAFQRKATGRTTKADSPLVHLVANHQARIAMVEQTMSYQALMDLAEQYPVPGFVTFNSSTLKNNGEGEYAMSADGFLEGNTVTFYRNGQKVNMTIQHKAFADALKKRGKQAESWYLDQATKVIGFMGLVRTGTPTFAKTALLRDVGMSLFNVQAAFRGKEKGFSAADWFALGTATARDTVKFLPRIAMAKADPANAHWTYKMYRSEGGIGKVTAYSVDAVSQGLERDVFEKGTLKGMAKKGAEKYLDILHASDDAARYSVWYNYLKKKNGGDFANEAELAQFLKNNPDIADNARNASKNITGNFEQRGMARGFRSHFMFWNAIQAGMRSFYGMLNPRYGMHGITSLSMLVGALAMGLGGSDERDEDGMLRDARTKDLGNTLRFGDFQVSVAQELRPAIYLGNSLRFLMDGTWDFNKAVNHTLDGMAQAVGMFSPASTGNALVDSVYALTPTVFQPIVLQTAETTFFGGDLAPEQYDTDGRKVERDSIPEAFRPQSGSSDTATSLARNLYQLTGGGIDVAPGSLDMWAQHALGGVLSMAKNAKKGLDRGESVPEAMLGLFTRGHKKEYNEFALKEETRKRFEDALNQHRITENGVILGKKSVQEDYKQLEALRKQMNDELKAVRGDDGTLADLYRQLDTLKATEDASPDEFVRITTAIESLRSERNYIYGRYNRLLLDMGY